MVSARTPSSTEKILGVTLALRNLDGDDLVGEEALGLGTSGTLMGGVGDLIL